MRCNENYISLTFQQNISFTPSTLSRNRYRCTVFKFNFLRFFSISVLAALWKIPQYAIDRAKRKWIFLSILSNEFQKKIRGFLGNSLSGFKKGDNTSVIDGAMGPLPKEPLFLFANWFLTVLLEREWWIKEKRENPHVFLSF